MLYDGYLACEKCKYMTLIDEISIYYPIAMKEIDILLAKSKKEFKRSSEEIREVLQKVNK